MSRRLAFQTQLASIMEVLANAAVAEICKLVDDDYAVVSFQMSQCQRENKALKRKLHLLELKLARGTVERRHRDLTGNHTGISSRAAGLRAAAEPLQEPLPPAGDVFVQHMEEALWSSRSIGEQAAVPLLSDNIHPLSPDVELVKEEKMEASMAPDADPEEGLRLIGDDGVLECSPAGAGAAAQKCDLEQKDCQSHSKSQIQSSPTKASSSRGVEVSGSSPPLVCEPGAQHSDMLQEAGNPPRDMGACDGDSHFDFSPDRSTNSLVEEIFDGTSHLDGPAPSCSYSLAAADFPSTSSSVNGRTRPDPLFPLPPDFNNANANALLRTGKERVFACSYCGKLFNRPKKLEIHQRTHTGERPFRCSVCGKMFSEAGNLKKHHRVHTGQKPYTCGVCGEGFAWIRNLKMHYMKSHPDVLTQDKASVQK